MSIYFYAARQPILDRDKNLYAYELLFRDGLENAFPNIDGDEATSRMIAGSQFNFGLDDFLGDKRGFINFTLDTLTKKYPSMLPADQIVVEILETVQPGKRLLAEVQELKEQGYLVALDDYIHQPVWRHFYPYIDIIKIDFRSTDQATIDTVIQATREFPNIRLLAEKVETNEEFQHALAMGFHYFQGYFFSKPEVMQSKSLSPAQMTLAELLYETSKSEMDLVNITSIFQRDINLSYKLLRYSNSAIFRRRSEIESIKQAIVVLGQVELKKFLSVLFTAQVASEKPAELMRLAMTRAKFAEGIAALHRQTDTAKAFLTGMMSLIDAILDEPMGTVLSKLPLAKEIKDALVGEPGLLSAYLDLVKCYEQAQWGQAKNAIAALKLAPEDVPDKYHEAVQWANEQMRALGDN